MAETVNTKQRAFVYLRQSADRDGTGAAVERQREDCLKLCQDRGWAVAGEYVDNDVSATNRKPRPAYVDMLAAIEKGGAEVIVAWHPDRLARRIIDLEGIVTLSERTGVRVATVTGDLDLTNDMGRMLARILASVAQGEVERKGARQRRAQQQAAQQGRPAGGRRAFGYASDGVTVNEAEARHFRAACQDVLEGASLKGIAKRWNDAGVLTTMGNKWTHSTVRNTLKNPRYAGKRTYRGEVVGPALWPGLVSEDDHDAVTALLSLPGRRTTITTARKYLLPGLAYCWKCGSDVATGHTRHGKRVYVCRDKKCISRKADPVDALIQGGEIEGVFVGGLVVERLSRPDAVELLNTRQTPEVAIERGKADAIRQRLDDLATGLEEGVLTLQAVRKSSERLRTELANVDARIHAATHADAVAPLVVARDVEKVWAGYDLQQRRAVVEALMTITLLPPERGHQAFDPESVRIEWKA